MKRWLAIGSVLLGAGVAWAAPTDSKTAVDLPSGAKLVGTAQVDEVRAFPEMNKNKMQAGTNKGTTETTRTEDIVGAGALDRVYETNKPYKDAVGYFDGKVKSGTATQLSRTVTRTATGWELQLPDGSTQNIVVRNTKPTTIETIQAVSTVERDTFSTGGTSATKPSTAPSMQPDTSKATKSTPSTDTSKATRSTPSTNDATKR
jgi:hypothetical protein